MATKKKAAAVATAAVFDAANVTATVTEEIQAQAATGKEEQTAIADKIAKQTSASPVVSSSVKDMVIHALIAAGGEKYLLQQAIDEPKTFISLIAKILPMQHEHGGNAKAEVVVYKIPDNERE